MAPPRRHLLLPSVFVALDGWLADPDVGTRGLTVAIRTLGDALGVDLGRLRVSAPPLPDLELRIGDLDGEDVELRLPGRSESIGRVQVAGETGAVEELVQGLEMVFAGGRARAQAARSARQLRALDEAVRGIGGVLDVDRVFQHIVDRVRDLVDAQYAAIGIVDADGAIERFVTSGISDEERARIGDLPRGRGLLGLIIRENRTYRIPDIATHPERYGFPPNHPEMHSFLGMPITMQGVAVGRLYLTNKIGAAEFSPHDQELVEMFALHAGIAIENARLHEQVRRLAVVDERDRISRDLHDSVIQSIYGQTLALDDVPEIMANDQEEAARRIDESIDALHGVIRDIRNFIFGLRPVLLEGGSLADGLEHLVTELRRSGGVEVEVSVAQDRASVEDLPIEIVAELLAITREGLSNIARHASATRAAVTLRGMAREVRLEITDDGRGFDAEHAAERGHHGLANMRARALALGGAFEVSSKPSGGTRIILTLPRRAAPLDEALER